MFGNFEVFIQLFLLALVLLAGPAVIFVLYFRGADM
ncbi:photosystem II reaction center protein Ycf12/Psb30 [Synechococcus sp. PCC 7336]|nr:photosystem II reaction center protein Ycf12 [Synechococcus sp. PCC 7336]